MVNEDMAEVEVTEEDTEGTTEYGRSAVATPDEKSRRMKKKKKKKKKVSV